MHATWDYLFQSSASRTTCVIPGRVPTDESVGYFHSSASRTRLVGRSTGLEYGLRQVIILAIVAASFANELKERFAIFGNFFRRLAIALFVTSCP